MQLYNTLSRQLETFDPNGNTITIYVCGITPYDTTHLGHCFTYATYDILIRYLEFNGHKVRYAQNVTDIDDDMIKKAAEIDEDWMALGNRWTVHFIDDNQAINIRPPDFLPRATDVIAEIIQAVGSLISAGVAYESNGNVYFHVADDPDYGKLSRLTYGQMLPIANERGNYPDDPNKRDPLDFVLWQAHSPGEPAWDSPWGAGRPGWHIECSTMSTKFLQQPIDIHGGGADLVFPHHESEIAQAECATGRHPFTRNWLHVAMLHYQGEKMSKSLGNLIMVRDLLETGWTPDAIRLCLAGHHYREEWDYKEADLLQADELRQKFIEAATAPDGTGPEVDCHNSTEMFRKAMEEDLNTPEAIAVLEKLANSILDKDQSSNNVQQAKQVLRDKCSILGLRLDSPEPEERVVTGWQRHRKRFTD